MSKLINRLIVLALIPLLKLSLRFDLKPDRRAEIEETIQLAAQKGIYK